MMITMTLKHEVGENHTRYQLINKEIQITGTKCKVGNQGRAVFLMLGDYVVYKTVTSWVYNRRGKSAVLICIAEQRN